MSGEKGHTLASSKQEATQGKIQETLRGEAFVTLLSKDEHIESWHFTQGGLGRVGVDI